MEVQGPVTEQDRGALPSSVRRRIGKNLHLRKDHPVAIVKHLVYGHLRSQLANGAALDVFDHMPPVVSVLDNFDRLLVPADHPARSPHDTFYLGADTVLRTHTSAHQHALLAAGLRNFCITGDVYRRDTVDRSHFPVFHQLEGVVEVPAGEDPLSFLARLVTGLVEHLFPECKHRTSPDTFPFTEPSLEVEVLYSGEWLEVLGCGVVHTDILDNLGIRQPLVAWGLGLDRLAMVLFGIPDIRLLWTDDPRFCSQFREGHVSRFKPYSTVPPATRDISFWVPAERCRGGGDDVVWNDLNSFHELVREQSENVESVVLRDAFVHPRTGRTSQTFSVCFSPVAAMRDGALLAAEANATMQRVGCLAAARLGVQLR